MYKELEEKIKNAKNIFLISHKKPDGDSLGSCCALMNYFSNTNKNFKCFCADKPANHYSYLAMIDKITTDFDLEDLKNNYDLIIAVDSGDEKQTGLEKIFTENKKDLPFVINIDHHPTNTRFGNLNIVKDKASSTTLILYDFFKKQKINIDKNMATCLLTGIETDTSFFTNGSTSLESMQASSDLLLNGAKPRKILLNNYKNKTLDILKIWGKALERLKINDDFSIASTVITMQDLAEFDLADDEIGGIANFLNNMSGVNAIVIIKEEKENKLKISMRTTKPDIDVSQIARLFGGGGHKKAAGFTIEGKVQETEMGWEIL